MVVWLGLSVIRFFCFPFFFLFIFFLKERRRKGGGRGGLCHTNHSMSSGIFFSIFIYFFLFNIGQLLRWQHGFFF